MLPSNVVNTTGGVIKELNGAKVHEIAAAMTRDLPEDATRLEIKAAAVVVYMGSLPEHLLQDSERNSQFVYLASQELATLVTALYGSAPQT
jgi:signal transduction histidine kinase